MFAFILHLACLVLHADACVMSVRTIHFGSLLLRSEEVVRQTHHHILIEKILHLTCLLLQLLNLARITHVNVDLLPF